MPLILFHHIPKTAGSSLSVELSHHLSPYHNIEVDYTNPRLDYISDMNAAVENFISLHNSKPFNSASGHLLPHNVQRIREAVPDVRVFTFLRNPLERYISDYRYQCSKLHPPHTEFLAEYPSISHYLDNPISHNTMTKLMLGNIHNLTPKQILRSVQEKYDFIGIVERYEESFRLLSSKYWKEISPESKVRVADVLENCMPLTVGQIRDINEANALDWFVYLSVLDNFRRRRQNC